MFLPWFCFVLVFVFGFIRFVLCCRCCFVLFDRWNATELASLCFTTNTNGHYLMADRPRVSALVDEYKTAAHTTLTTNAILERTTHNSPVWVWAAQHDSVL
eukprot:c20325_g1_i12.p5 GENE.c20325_g1_i12~~c20325_g1_i12.p5  ORF type:complete len:101 (-),score=17.47 c20325_g1_i12:320-622(-)